MQGVLGSAPSVLRADSALPSPTAAAPMVSLDLLMGSGTPATPRDPVQVREAGCRRCTAAAACSSGRLCL